MTKFETVKNRIFAGSDMDYVGICPSSVLENEPAGHRPSDFLPNAKSIIVFGRRLINGSVQTKFRQYEDGILNVSGSYSAHSFVLSINHMNLVQTYNIAQYLENTFGCFAMPLTNNVVQAVQPTGNFLPMFADPYNAGLPIDIYKAAVAAGIGEMGFSHRVITPDNGPRVYINAIVTSMEFEEYDQPYSGEKLCDPEKCGVCVEMCPTHAIKADETEEWEVAGKKYQVSKLNVNGCALACMGYRKELNPRATSIIDTDNPTDEQLKAAIDKQKAYPGMQQVDHVPMYHCDKCLIYCPVGNWKEKFTDHGLSRK